MGQREILCLPFQNPEGDQKLEISERNPVEEQDKNMSHVLKNAVLVEGAVLQKDGEIDNAVLESLAGPPGQPQTIVLVSPGKNILTGFVVGKCSGNQNT